MNVLSTSGGPVPAQRAHGDLLAIQGVSAGYGGTAVLHDVSLAVPEGTLVALLGANGAGKTTLLRVAAGLLKPTSGNIRLRSDEITGDPAYRRVRRGLCLIPEGRGIFPSLTVRDNLDLQVPPWVKTDSVDRVVELFPVLGRRMKQVAGTLSGGEQQMLGLARAVQSEPSVILVDEISMGLAPLLIDSLFVALTALAASGISMLIVEQYIERALDICPLAYIMSKGAIVYAGSSAALDRDDVIDRYLGA